MDAKYKTLLYHTEVSWLSKGNVLRSLPDVYEKVKEVFKQQGKNDWVALISEPLIPLFEKRNSLNLSLQGKESI